MEIYDEMVNLLHETKVIDGMNELKHGFEAISGRIRVCNEEYI